MFTAPDAHLHTQRERERERERERCFLNKLASKDVRVRGKLDVVWERATRK